jgi:hypothetical protein
MQYTRKVRLKKAMIAATDRWREGLANCTGAAAVIAFPKFVAPQAPVGKGRGTSGFGLTTPGTHANEPEGQQDPCDNGQC